MAVDLLEIHPAALEEIRSAVAWYRDRNESAAMRFVGEVDDAVALITQTPYRWPAGTVGTRKFVLRRFPFAVIYRVNPGAIQVVAVAHGHRRPGYWRSRL